MHDTHDVRKSIELDDLTDHRFRSELIQLLERIAKALEYIEGGIIHVAREEF